MKRLFFLLTLCVPVITFAQSNWMTLQTELIGEYETPLNVIPTSNSTNTETALYFELTSKGKIYRINNKQQTLNEIEIDKLPKRTKLFVGSCTDDITYKMFFSNQSKTRLGSITVDFSKNTYTINKDLFRFKEEKVLANFNNKNTFYTLTISKKGNDLRLYSYNVTGLINTQKFDLNKFILDSNIEFDDVFLEDIKSGGFKVIDTELPSSLIVAKNNKKLYLNGDELILTSNALAKFSHLINISINAGTINVMEFEHPTPKESFKFLGSNSFVLDSKLWSILGYKNMLELAVFNMDSGELLKTFTANKNQEIAFKNTALQTKDLLKGEIKALKSNSEFFQTLKSGNIAISGFKVNNQYILTIGSSREIHHVNYVPIIIGGGALGGFASGLIFSSFDSYYKSITTEFKSLLDASLNHVDGKISDNIFDRLINFNSNKPNAIAPAIFNSNTNFIWGAFGKSSGFYQMFKFDN